MIITEDVVDGKTVIYLDGRFDFGARKTFKDGIDRSIESGIPIVLDLEKVTFVDSSALGLLVISHQNLKNKHIPFYLINPQTYVKQVLDLANIGKMIPTYPTLKDVPQNGCVAPSAPA